MKRRSSFLLAAALLIFGLQGCTNKGSTGAKGDQGDTGPQGPPGGAPTTSVEACLGCHGPAGVAPVVDIETPGDVHFLDTDPDGPQTASGYRRLVVTLTQVDVTGSSVVIDFDVEDENGAPVDDLFDSDGRFTIARLDAGTNGDPNVWVPFITRIENPGVGPGTVPVTQGDSERFTSGTFQNLAGGSYRYTSSFDPTSVPVADGDTLRVAIQISASDIPAGNGWCDFDADTASPNDCVSGVSLTRDIVQTATCNGCHGVTADTHLALHGGGRTQVEYCVTCHNPTSKDANSGNSVNFPVLIHKIHRGADLENGFMIYGFGNSLHDYSNVEFTKNLDDCAICHTGGGADEDNWSTVPNMAACGACHDDVDFASGAGHPDPGNQQIDNSDCANCHPQSGPIVPPATYPVETVHEGMVRRLEADTYNGGSNGLAIEDLDYDFDTRTLSVEYSVTKSGSKMDLDNDPEWASGSLTVRAGWASSDYTNEGSGNSPAQPLSTSGLAIGSTVTDLMNGNYLTTIQLPSSASGSATATLEARARANLSGGGPPYTDQIPVIAVTQSINVGSRRASTIDRRQVVDVAKCNRCHDAAGQGISLHGNNRTGNPQLCVLCHNPNATDISRRPADPAMAVDGKREESIDFKRLVHKIHSGAELENGFVVYGFNSSVHDFGTVEFIGNRQNCETCHIKGTYGAVQAHATTPSTIDTGADLDDPDDDLNISPTAAVCSACHDDQTARDHMELHGASFEALDEDIL